MSIFKRALDLAVCVPTLLFGLPVAAAIAVAIRLDSPGPILFRQPRRGKNFFPFTILKFRTLEHRVADPHERYEMRSCDPRITRVGRFLRRSSLDELPQVLHILQGSMSLVGPRPLVEWESRELLRTHPDRFSMKPGLTGLSQITIRNAGTLGVRSDKDIEYVRHWSAKLDAWIVMRTPLSLLRSDSIYPDYPRKPS